MQRLVINRTNVNPVTGRPLYDKKGNPLPPGTLHIKGNVDNFEEEVVFRPIAIANRYFSFNAKENKYDGETVYVYSKWHDDLKQYIVNQPLDNKGGLRLGRPDSDKLKAMSEIEQDHWRKKVRWQMCLFGLVYFQDSPEGILVEFNYSGKTGLEITEIISRNKKPWYKNLFIIKTEKDGDVLKPVFKKLRFEPKVDDKVFNAMKETYRHIENINKHIEELHRKIVDSRSGLVDKAPVKKGGAGELNDEIPY